MVGGTLIKDGTVVKGGTPIGDVGLILVISAVILFLIFRRRSIRESSNGDDVPRAEMPTIIEAEFQNMLSNPGTANEPSENDLVDGTATAPADG
jgi:hypothetical protein